MRLIWVVALDLLLGVCGGLAQGSPEGAWKYVSAGHQNPVSHTRIGWQYEESLRTNILVISALIHAHKALVAAGNTLRTAGEQDHVARVLEVAGIAATLHGDPET